MQQLDDTPELIERTERITASSAAAQLAEASHPLLIDVRTSGEWDKAHVDGALNLPLAQLSQRMSELPVDRPLIVYCASGYRSAIATSLLLREGLSDVANLVGGLGAWDSARLPAVAAER
jgi:rhodanese-related sulfurtransferase